MRVALAIALVFAGAAPGAADAMAFVTACRTTAKDPKVEGGALFALVHEVEQPQTVLYLVSGPRVSVLAWLRPASPDTKGAESFEAEGGMWSSARASDVLAYLRQKPFRFVADWRQSLASSRATLPPCAIDYRVLGGYERRH